MDSAPDSPPLSPLSPPPSWFNDKDVECPLSEEPWPASSPLSAPSSPLSPPPSWFRDEDTECPDFAWLATEARGDEIERPPVAGLRQDGSLPLSSSPLSSVPASEDEPKGQKRPFKFLDDSYGTPAKRMRSAEDPDFHTDYTSHTESPVELGTPIPSTPEPEASDVSDLADQGEDSVFTQAVIEPGTPLSPLDGPETSDGSNIIVQGDDSDIAEPVAEPGTPIASPRTPGISFLPSVAPLRVHTVFTETTYELESRLCPVNELETCKPFNILPREEKYPTFPKAIDEHGMLSPQPREWENIGVCSIVAHKEDAVSTEANEYGTHLLSPAKTVVFNKSDIRSPREGVLSIEAEEHGRPSSPPAGLQMSKISDFTSQGNDLLSTEAIEPVLSFPPQAEREMMDHSVPAEAHELGTPQTPAGELQGMGHLVFTEANQYGTTPTPLRSDELGIVQESMPTEANELGTLLTALSKLKIEEHSTIKAIGAATPPLPRGNRESEEDSVTDANEPGTLLLQPGEPSISPKPQSKPEVWATLRGGLCEALSYFRAYKGSLHTQDRTAIGFLIDKEASARDVFGPQVIISSVGGGRVLDAETNERVRCEDAPDDAANIKAIRRAYECRALIAVVAGQDHPLYPCKPPHPYAVLDWFYITDLWAELHETRPGYKPVRVWRMRFEKADLSKPSWWAPPADEEPSPTVACRYHTSSKRCRKCGLESKEIFKTGWTCLNHLCASLFQFPIRRRVPVNELEHTDAFLNERSPFVGPLPPLRPAVPNFDGLHGTEKRLRHGFVCPECGHCNRRVFWNRFSCESCPYKLESVMLPYPWEDLAKEEATFDHLIARRRKKKPVKNVVVRRQPVEAETGPESSDEGDTDAEDDSPHNFDDEPDIESVEPGHNFRFQPQHPTSIMNNTRDGSTSPPPKQGKGDEPFSTIFNRHGIKIAQTLYFGSYKVRQYFLPDPEGSIIGSFALFMSNPKINAAPNGPNELFRELELVDIGLKRNAAALPGNKLEGLCRHFQQNFGAKYKFGVSVQSKGFDQAPDAILLVLQRLVWVAKNAVEATTSRLAEHDLGPDGPPPTSNDFNELLALGYMEDDRINYHDDGESELGPTVAALSLGSPSTMRFRPKLRPWSAAGSSLPKKANKKAFLDVLEVPMKHGDMIVMHGAAIHRYYEHAVESMGRCRFALTCRYIDPEKMTDQADRDDAAIKGAIPEHAKKFVYNGDL